MNGGQLIKYCLFGNPNFHETIHNDLNLGVKNYIGGFNKQLWSAIIGCLTLEYLVNETLL